MSIVRRARRPQTNSTRTTTRRFALLLLPLLLALSLAASPVAAQVDVTATAGTPAASYTTLKGAFDAVNAGTHQGVIGMGISGDTTETAPAVLNASGAGAAIYTTISISPTGGAPRTISGAIVAGSPLIDLNGADNVTIDGLNSGGNSLTISNTTVSATSATSTIRFIGGATNNVITNSNILGSSSSAVATNGGSIFFSTDAVTTNGNDNNTISNNNIGPAGANLPSKAILCNGSTGTTAIGNSGNIVDNNNIFDYFGAAVTSAGVAANGGCNTSSITNNRFYQTGTRTWTTGALHNAINIGNTTATSGAQGYTITGNIVGFASNTQTGTYTLTGSTGKFVGILFNGIVAGTTTNVNNNTVASVSVTGVTSSGTTTASPLTGILLQEGNVISNGNTIGSQSATGSLVLSTTTTGATDIYGIHNFTSNAWTSNANTVGGMSATNLGASGTFLMIGMRAFTGTTTTWTASNNTVGGNIANSMQLAATGTSSQVLGMFSSNAPTVLTSNTIRNLTTNIGTGTTTTASVIGISLTSATPSHTLSRNTIFNLTNTNAAAASVVSGIQFAGAAANLVERNLIHSLTVATNSTAAEVNGIRIASGTTTYRNNMIAVGAGIASAIGTGSTTGGINGIFEAAGTNNFFHNSVYVGGAPTAGAGPSYGFASTQVTVVRSNRDNIYFNARSNAGASGKNYAIRVAGTAPNPTGLTLNNNVYFANGVGAVFGFFNSLDVANLAAWKTAVGQDSASIEGDPAYNDPTNAIPDLHIHPTNPTVIESNGQDVGVIDDFDGQTRSGFTPVDIGADAGNFNGIDLGVPSIAYTPLGNTSLTTNRALAATITDAGSGVPTAGIGLPVIYFRKGVAGVFASTQASSGGGGVYNFTIDYSLVAGGSVATGDTIQYYVVAQDGAATPNVTSNPSAGASGYSANPPAAATPPTPNSYLIAVPISGIKTVCAAACDFTTLTTATGIFNAINTGVVTGNIEIQIAGDLIVEDGAVALGTLPEQPSGSNFTVRLYPTGVARAITGAVNTALIRMSGASRITLDGSIGGIGTDRSLTITNTSVTSPSVVLFGSVGATPVSNDVLKNCVIINGINTSSAVVISDATSVGAAGLFSNIAIQNNDIQRAFIGVFASGGTTPQGGSNLVYTQNKLDTSGAFSVRNVGLYMQGVNGATVSQNTVANLSNTEGENDTAIWLATGTTNATVSGNTVSNLGMTLTTGFAPFGIRESSGLTAAANSITGNTITNLTTTGSTGLRGITVGSGGVTVDSNGISGIINNNTGTFGAFGIDVVSGNDVVIKNNFVSDVNHNMTGGAAFTPDFGVVGIRLGAGTGHKVYYNSVNLFGPHTGTAATQLLSAAFSISTTAQTGIDVRNNVFANNITGGTTGIAHVSVFLPSGGTAAMNLTWNNNAYFFGTDAARQGVGQAGTTSGTNFFTTLPLLAAYSSTLSPAGTNDNASQASNGGVPFLSSTDLHLAPASTLISAAVPIGTVTNDFDGDPRPPVTPDIGADEIVAGIMAFSSPTYSAGESAGTATITVNRTGGSAGSVSIDYATVAGGSATGGAACTVGVDFVNASGTLTFGDTVTSQTFPVTICPDALNEANETVNLALSNPLGGSILGTPNTAVLTITDDDPAPTISITDVTLPEGNAGPTVFGFVVSLSAASGQTVTVHYQTADGTATTANNDYVGISDTILTFTPGVTTMPVNVTVNGDTTPEANENFFVNLTLPTNATILDNQGAGSITNDDAATGPVTVTATAGTPGPTDYPTVKDAFDAINAGTHQGDITVSVIVSTTETAPAVLNSSGAGAAVYTSVLVRPSNDGVSISSATATGRGVIELNGADNVTIDGDNPGTAGTNRDLTIQNTAVNTTTLTSVVRVALSTLVNSANNVVVRNTVILGSATGRNIAGATSTTTGSEFSTYGILVGGGASTVAATTAPSALANVTTVIGAGITATNFTANNNQIDACARGIAVQGSAVTVAPGLTVTGNVIGSATAANTTTVYARGMTLQGFDATASIAGNTVRNMESFVGTNIAGISLGDINAAGTGATLNGNNVSGVFNRGTGTFGAWGISVAAGNAMTLSNNFVSNLRQDMTGGAAFSTTFGVMGIRLATGLNHKVYFNSVNLSGAYVGTPTPTLLSASLAVATTAMTGLDIRNNILSNTLTGGTTSIAHVALFLPVSGTSAMNLTLNNNAYFTGTTPGASGIAHVGATYTAVPAGPATFAGLYTVANFDRTSVTPNANLRAYVSTLSAGGTNDNATFAQTAPAPFTSSTDLHISPVTLTFLESGGAAGTGITTDIDLDARGVTPDIGADEFTGTPPPANDIAALAILTPANSSTFVTGSSTSPQATFKNVGTAAQVSVNVQFTITGPGGYSYTNAQSIPTINPGQIVQVNFAAAPAFTTPGAYVTTATVTTADSNAGNDSVVGGFSVVPPFGGTTTVGTGGFYPSLTNAGGLFQALNTMGTTSNVLINVVSDLTGETGTVPLNEITGGFSVTIKPSGAARVISGSGATNLIKLAGVDNVTIDGSLAAGTDRSLTITNAAAGPIVWIGTNATSGANNITIKNTNLTGPGAFAGQGIIASSGTTLGNPAEFPQSNNTIQNNAIKGVQNAAFLTGNAATLDQNWSIVGNDFGSTVVAEKLSFRGMLLGNAANFTISGNNLAGVNSGPTSTATMSGIQLSATLNGGSVVRNKISDIKHNNAATATSGTNGIFLAATSTASNVLVANNFVSDIASPGTTGVIATSNGYGIVVATGGGYSIVANSVLMNTNQGANAATANSAAVNIATGLPAASIDLRDNILANTQTLGTRFAVIDSGTAAVFSTINFNDYFAQNVGSLGGTQTTLANWQAATGQDANSLAVDPLFMTVTAPADLHLQTGSPMLDAGTAVAAVTVDIDNEPRPAATPDIGADEIVQANLGITKTDGTTIVVAGGTTTYTIVASNVGASNAPSSTVTDTFPAVLTCSTTCVTAGGASCTAGPFAGNINDSVNLPAGGSVTYTAVCSISGAATGSIVNTATVAAGGGVTDPVLGNNSATDTDTVGVVSNANVGITKTDGSATEVPGTPVTYTIVVSNAGPAAASTVSVVDNFAASLSGCSTTCAGVGGGTCAAGPTAGNISDTANLPNGASVTYTATCNISPSATGTLANTATATVTGASTDPTPGNNSATDTDTLNASADVSITKTDGSLTENPGTTVTYTITATNAGPSSAPSVTIADTFVSKLTGCSTTCIGSGGGTCSAGPLANNLNDNASLPFNATVTYTAVCNIIGTATGTLNNTATATVAVPVVDPVSANNSATDIDTLNSNVIFTDGFESGGFSAWSSTVPLTFEAYSTTHGLEAGAVTEFAYDFSAVQSGRTLEANTMAFVTDLEGRALFQIQVRRTSVNGTLEATLEVTGGASSNWVPVGEVGQLVRIEWSNADANHLGFVSVSLDGHLSLWVDGFAPANPPSATTLLRSTLPAAE
ncbi:MAG: Calx-beta domain-containing protein [Thermoanaerobaculia bacterium]